MSNENNYQSITANEFLGLIDVEETEFTTTGRIVPAEPPTIYFHGKDELEIMRLEPNGDIYVHGRLVEKDEEVVDGLRQLLNSY